MSNTDSNTARPAPPDEPAVPESMEPAAVVPPTRRQLMMLASDMGMASIDEAVMKFALAALARFGRPTTPPALPSMYIDPEHQGEDLELLQTFYRGCRTVVDGTDDEIHLRGIRAVLAARAALAAEPVGEGPTNWPAYFMRVADMQAREIEGMLRQSQPGMVEALPPPPPAPAEGEGPSTEKLIGLALGREPWATWLRSGGCLESAHCELADLMLAVLARWGRPAAPHPAPVAWCRSDDFLAAEAKRQSFSGWREQHRDCDMALYITKPPAPEIPEEIRLAFAELERKEQSLRDFRSLRESLAADRTCRPAAPPAPLEVVAPTSLMQP